MLSLLDRLLRNPDPGTVRIKGDGVVGLLELIGEDRACHSLPCLLHAPICRQHIALLGDHIGHGHRLCVKCEALSAERQLPNFVDIGARQPEANVSELSGPRALDFELHLLIASRRERHRENPSRLRCCRADRAEQEGKGSRIVRCSAGNNLLHRRVVKDRRCCRHPDRVECNCRAVRSRYIRDRLTVREVCRTAAGCTAPAAEGIARARILIRGQRIRISAAEIRICHTADCMRRAGIVVHRIALLPVDCVNREISGQRLVKVIGRAVRFCPVVKDKVCLVVRTRGLGRRAAVHRIRILRNDRILMARIRIRRILHRHGIVAECPAGCQNQVAGHRCCKIRWAAVRVLPVRKGITGATARRGTANRGRCNHRIAVDNGLLRRRYAAAVCVKAHRIARQEVIVRECRLRCSTVSDRCREGTSGRLLFNRHAAVHHRSGLRDVVGDAIHCVVVGVTALCRRRAAGKRCACKLAELIDIVTREQETNRT